MSRIVYSVASSIDGVIAGRNDVISDFNPDGDGVDKYLSYLQYFKTVILGRRKYEFGYQYGLKPGQPANSNIEHFIFSDSLKLEKMGDTVHVEKRSIDRVIENKTESHNSGRRNRAFWKFNEKSQMEPGKDRNF